MMSYVEKSRNASFGRNSKNSETETSGSCAEAEFIATLACLFYFLAASVRK